MEAENGQTSQGVQALLPLDEPRVIAIKDGKFAYTFYFSRISQADWAEYFSGISHTTRNDGKKRIESLDMNTPGIELFERKLIRTEGYAGDFATRPNWQAKIPPRHSNPVAWLLRAVGPSTAESDIPFDPERIEVRLDAVWSQLRPGDETAIFKGLVHRFAPPSAADKKRFYAATTASSVIGGSRNGLTVHATRHRVLLELYDQLIVEVEGYGIGNPVRSLGAEEIRREMDACHKFEAVTPLFLGSAMDSSASEDETEAA